MKNSKLNPENYKTYDNYLKALGSHKNFKKLSKQASTAINESKSDQEMIKKMEDIEYSYHKDEFCCRKFCQKRQICLWLALESFQGDCNNYFFEGLLPESDLIFSKKDIDRYLQSGCHFPEEWDDEQCPEYMSIILVIDIEDSFLIEETHDFTFEELVHIEEVKKIFRNLYLFLLYILKQRSSAHQKRVFNEVQEFLKNNSFIDDKLSKKFLVRFNKIVNLIQKL